MRLVIAAVVFGSYRQETTEIVAISSACCLYSESVNVSSFREPLRSSVSLCHRVYVQQCKVCLATKDYPLSYQTLL